MKVTWITRERPWWALGRTVNRRRTERVGGPEAAVNLTCTLLSSGAFRVSIDPDTAAAVRQDVR